MLTKASSKLSDALEDVIYRSIGCALEVHTRLGPGYGEPIYHKAMRIELAHQGLQFENQPAVMIKYRDQSLQRHRLDLIVEKQVILELKVVAKFHPVHTAQVVSYLRSTGLPVGLLINFNTDWLKGSIKRIVL